MHKTFTAKARSREEDRRGRSEYLADLGFSSAEIRINLWIVFSFSCLFFAASRLRGKSIECDPIIGYAECTEDSDRHQGVAPLVHVGAVGGEPVADHVPRFVGERLKEQ